MYITKYLIFNCRYTSRIIVVKQGILALQNGGKGGLILWPISGASNQLLASLTLLIITVFLSKKGKNIIYTFIPFLFMTFMTSWAMLIQLNGYYLNKTSHLLIIGGLIVFLEIWMLVEGFIVLTKHKK